MGAGIKVGGRFRGCQAPGAFTPAGSACISAPPAEASRANLHLPPHPLPPSLPPCPAISGMRPPPPPGSCVQRRTRDPTTKQRCQGANGARCLPGALPAPHLLGPPPPPAPIPGRVPPPSTSPAAGSERDRQQCLRSGDYDVDASPPTTAENGFLGLCKRICLSVGAKLCRSRLWLALFIYFLVCFLWSSLLPPSAKMQGAGVLTINW